jgi:Acyl-CoA carboxylase epsilon subunit
MEPRVMFSVVRGRPSAEELAAITVVLGAAAAQRSLPAPAHPARSQWSARARLVRPALRPGAGAWRASGLP